MTQFWWETPLGQSALEDVKSRAAEVKESQFETVIQRLRSARYGAIGEVTPDTCMQSPTVHAIVTAISRRIAVSPVHVYRKTTKNGRDAKERIPNHPVARLLQYPNKWQSRSEYWLDAASTFVRYGRFYAWKSRGTTGPIRELLPISPREICVEQDRDTWAIRYRRGAEFLDSSKVHYVRGPARNFIEGDSPVNDVQTAIALEIAAEKFGATFFENGALPLLFFTFMQGSKGFQKPEDAKQFTDDFQSAFGGARRFRAMVGPQGLDKPTSIPIENDKAQFLETRKYQRTVIAGAFGVPPHLVGDLERATFNNVEQQDTDFTSNVIQPVTAAFEAAMERDLLTDEDVNSGVVIRFNLDSILRADFKSRQEGLQVQRRNGVINANEWREIERLNPISEEDGGEDYIHEQNMVVAGQEPELQPDPPQKAGEPDPMQELDKSIKALKEFAA
jgi:HK97 family phage portal protein